MLLRSILPLLATQAVIASQVPLQDAAGVSLQLFQDLERTSRLADIAYCVAPPSLGISKPFACLSRCDDFPNFELVTSWNTGPLLSDSAGYLALDHRENGTGQIVVAFRGTYSIANAVADLSTIPQEYAPYPGEDGDGPGQHSRQSEDKCVNCTVHIGFNRAWQNTRERIMPDLLSTAAVYPKYSTTLIGHSLGGAVAMLAALELHSRGLGPTVTTFGEPRVGNQGLVNYFDQRFHLNKSSGDDLRYRRVTHIDDPIPLLPLTEWGFAMHAGEIFIRKAALSPDLTDLQLCAGDTDPDCIAGQDHSLGSTRSRGTMRRDLLGSVKNEIHDVLNEPWGIPSRYKLWELLFAHRDYFHRIGLCVPGGDPLGGGHDYNDSVE